MKTQTIPAHQNKRISIYPRVELFRPMSAAQLRNTRGPDALTHAQLMHEFFRMGREERAKNLAEAERYRHRADTKETRFRKMLEDRFIEQTAAKASERK